jgi:putative ABC transport system permease protein
MLKSYFTLALRNLRKRKVYSFINIAGLSIGMAVCLVILRYVDFELSYDRFHENAEQIYRTTKSFYQNGEYRGTGIISGYAEGPLLRADLPEVKTYVRTHPMYGGAVVTYQGDGEPVVFFEEDMQFADSTFFDVFTYAAEAGDLGSALDDPNSVVITREMADKYFGPGADAVGKTILVSGGWANGNYTATAVLKEVPQNSHFVFDMIFPIHNLLQNPQYTNDDGWGWNNFVTYIQLHPGVDVKGLETKLAAFIEKYRGQSLAESNSKLELKLQPILDIHLSPGLDYESSATISPSAIYFFIIISIFILAIAWINYINLSTARAMERAREVGIKKALGVFRKQLITQFVFESILVNFIGVAAAVLVAIGLLPVVEGIVGKELAFDFSDYRFWLILVIMFTVGSLVSGAYPAFVLSSFKTVEVIKGKIENVTGGFSLRKALVVFQFAASLILIAGTFAIYRQMVYMRNQNKGLTMEQMLIVNGPKVVDGERKRITERLITLKRSLSEIPGVVGVTTSGAIPGGGYNWGTSIRRDGAPREEDQTGSIVWIDPDFVPTYGITMLAGRNFNPAIRSDMESVLINEASVKAFGLGDPEAALSQRLVLGGGDTVNILGVLKNYHWNSLKTEHTPWLFKADTIASRHFSLLLGGGTPINEIVKKVEDTYKEAFPGNPFDYQFLDDFFNTQYKAEQQFAQIFGFFAVLAIFIACLGLWGLASFTTALKLKEIGIRKVLGASAGSIVSLLSWQFSRLVLIASVIAIPLTWYGIDSWLNNFAFRTKLAWDLFVVPMAILSLLALGTVSVQIIRGASVNPARILRTE